MIEIILMDYIKFIKGFENLMNNNYIINTESILSGIGILFPKQGKIENYIYEFHGAGCRLEKDGTICEYQYYLSTICFTLWDFKLFINSHPTYKFNDFNDKFLEIELYKLIEEKKLYWKITTDGVVLKVYQFTKFD